MQKHVLIIDDDPVILMSLELLLKKNNYTVLIGRDGLEAIELLKTFMPQVILLDIMMPNMDGYELCQYIKNQPTLQHIKIIFLSAKSKQADIQKGLAMGADDYFTKPFSNKLLLEKVAALTA